MAVGQKLPPFVHGHALVPPPNVPDVNLGLISTKIHKRLLEPYNQYWWHPRGGGEGKSMTL
jgi:hypothetical protein